MAMNKPRVGPDAVMAARPSLNANSNKALPDGSYGDKQSWRQARRAMANQPPVDLPPAGPRTSFPPNGGVGSVGPKQSFFPPNPSPPIMAVPPAGQDQIGRYNPAPVNPGDMGPGTVGPGMGSQQLADSMNHLHMPQPGGPTVTPVGGGMPGVGVGAPPPGMGGGPGADGGGMPGGPGSSPNMPAPYQLPPAIAQMIAQGRGQQPALPLGVHLGEGGGPMMGGVNVRPVGGGMPPPGGGQGVGIGLQSPGGAPGMSGGGGPMMGGVNVRPVGGGPQQSFRPQPPAGLGRYFGA